MFESPTNLSEAIRREARHLANLVTIAPHLVAISHEEAHAFIWEQGKSQERLLSLIKALRRQLEGTKNA